MHCSAYPWSCYLYKVPCPVLHPKGFSQALLDVVSAELYQQACAPRKLNQRQQNENRNLQHLLVTIISPMIPRWFQTIPTNVDVRDNMLLNPVGKVLTPFRTTDETILLGYQHKIKHTKLNLTSSASQLAITIVLTGFQPRLCSTPNPRTISTNAAVPDTGSVAPIPCVCVSILNQAGEA